MSCLSCGNDDIQLLGHYNITKNTVHICVGNTPHGDDILKAHYIESVLYPSPIKHNKNERNCLVRTD